MDSSSSDDEDIIVASIVAYKNKKRRKQTRKYWTHGLFSNRMQHGEYFNIIKQLEADSDKFFEYFRMRKEQFDYLLNMTYSQLHRQSTHLRDSISGRER
jgi:hypothetical protein